MDKILYIVPGVNDCLRAYDETVIAANDFLKEFKHMTGKKLDKENFERLITKQNPNFNTYFPPGKRDEATLTRLFNSFRKAQSAIPVNHVHGFDVREIKYSRGFCRYDHNAIRKKYFEMRREDCLEGAELVEKAFEALEDLYQYLKDKNLNPSFTGGLDRLSISGPQGIIKTDWDKIEIDWGKLYRKI